MSETMEKDVAQDVAKSPATLEKTNGVDSSNQSMIVQQVNRGLSSLNLFNDKDLAAAEAFLTKVMRSDKGGIKTVQDGLAILMRAQDLNLPFSTCIEHIHVINGKTGIDIHIVKALLLKAGCTWRCVKDYQPLYEFTDGINVYTDGSFPEYVVRCVSQKDAEEKAKTDIEKGISDFTYVYPVKWYQDFTGNKYKDYQLNTQRFGIAINKQQVAEIAKTGKTPVYRIPNQPIDYVTEYEITRKVGEKEISAIGRFSYSDAVAADMFSKDTYKKYPKVLIGHRAFTYAARDIASDVLFGCMETTELKIVTGKELDHTDIVDIEEVEAIEVK